MREIIIGLLVATWYQPQAYAYAVSRYHVAVMGCLHDPANVQQTSKYTC